VLTQLSGLGHCEEVGVYLIECVNRQRVQTGAVNTGNGTGNGFKQVQLIQVMGGEQEAS